MAVFVIFYEVKITAEQARRDQTMISVCTRMGTVQMRRRSSWAQLSNCVQSEYLPNYFLSQFQPLDCI